MTAAGDGSQVFRFGTGAETAEDLELASEQALRHGFPHGVSVRSVTARPDVSVAARSDVELYFIVHKTGANPHHFTVELPHPVTPDVARVFNRLFGRQE